MRAWKTVIEFFGRIEFGGQEVEAQEFYFLCQNNQFEEAAQILADLGMEDEAGTLLLRTSGHSWAGRSYEKEAKQGTPLTEKRPHLVLVGRVGRGRAH